MCISCTLHPFYLTYRSLCSCRNRLKDPRRELTASCLGFLSHPSGCLPHQDRLPTVVCICVSKYRLPQSHLSLRLPYFPVCSTGALVLGRAESPRCSGEVFSVTATGAELEQCRSCFSLYLSDTASPLAYYRLPGHFSVAP